NPRRRRRGQPAHRDVGDPVNPSQPAAIRRKVQAWISERHDPTRPDESDAIALHARPHWSADPLLVINGHTVRVVPCATPLAVRAALHDRRPGDRTAILT